jgi:cytochrome c oxidase assembly factor CtaG
MSLPLVLAHIGGGTLAPLHLAPATLTGVLYALRVHQLRGTPRAVPAWRQLCLYGGLTLIVVTLASPLAHVSDELFAAHMAEHLLIADIGGLLLVLGMTGPVLAPLLRVRWLGWVRAFSHPVVALVLWAVNFYAWHLPVLYQGAIHHEAVHALEHALFIGFGVGVWMPLFGPLPRPPWFGNLAKLVYIIAVRLAGAVLGNVLIWGGQVFYPTYASGERYWHVSPLADQNAAGAIMMIEGSILTICLFGWLFMQAARQSEERQELLDLAGRRGYELTEQRAGRAVAAGRGEDLRRRIEAGPGDGPDHPDAAPAPTNPTAGAAGGRAADSAEHR